MLLMNWRMVNKQLICWVFYHGVVSFFSKFGNNWMNFDVSAPFSVSRAVQCPYAKMSEIVRGLDIPVAYVMPVECAAQSNVRKLSGLAAIFTLFPIAPADFWTR